MQGVVNCQQCGAPHRPVRGQTRFACEWCSAENSVHLEVHTEELVVLGSCDQALARARADEVLRRRGVRNARIAARPMRWTVLWQVVSESGDEFVHCGVPDPARLETTLRMPTATLVPLDDERAPRNFDPATSASLGVTEIVAAARATFDDGDAPLRAVRCVWVPVSDLEVRVGPERTSGLYVGGSDEVVFEPMPARATDAPLQMERLAAFSLFVVGALLLGLLLPDLTTRTLALMAWTVVGFAEWGIRNFLPVRGRA